MPPRSKVNDLAPELRTELDRLLREGRFSLDQVVAHLRQLTEDPEVVPSRSSIGRYAQNFSAISARLRQSEELTSRLVAEAGPEMADGKGFQILIQGFQSLAFQLLANLPEGETLDPKNLSHLAGAIKDVMAAQKGETDRLLKVRVETAKAAAVAVDKVGKAQGLTPETVLAIREAVLGVSA